MHRILFLGVSNDVYVLLFIIIDFCLNGFIISMGICLRTHWLDACVCVYHLQTIIIINMFNVA